MYFNVYALPVLTSALLGFLLAYFAWGFKMVPGARQFALLSAAAATYSLGYALEISSAEMSIALLWVRYKYLGSAFLPALIILFAASYAGNGFWLNKRITSGFFVIPVITVLMVFTMRWHELFYRNIHMDTSGLFPLLVFSVGPWYNVHLVYSALATLLGIGILFMKWRHSSSLFRKQVVIATGALLVPWGAYVAFRTNAVGWPLDLTTYSFSFSAILFFVGLFRYRMFSLPPLARSVLFEQIPEGVLIVDLSCQVVDANSPAKKLLGIRGEDIGRPIDEVLENWPEVINLCVERQQKKVASFPRTGDGATRWYEAQSIPLKYPQHELVGQMLLVRDITDRKQTEIEMQNAYRYLDTLIEFLPDAIFAVNTRGEVTIWNRAIEEMTGIKKEEILGKGGYAYSVPFYGEPRPMLVDMVLNQALEDQEPFQYFNKEERSLMGEVFCAQMGEAGKYIWGKAAPLYDSQGRLNGAIETIQDISRMKLGEKELIRQKNHWEALFKNAKDAIVLFDREHRVLDINDVFTETFGYTLEEIRGEPLDDVLDRGRAGTADRDWTEEVLTGKRVVFEGTRYDRNGRPMEMLVKGIPIVIDGEFIGGYGIYTDITEAKQNEQRLRFLSMRDQLTGLYNRTFFEEEMRRLQEGRDFPITIISADLDALKIVNDSLGHDCGDTLLKACATVFRRALRGSDIVARVGGDEFAILLSSTTEEAGTLLCRRIYDAVREYNQDADLPLNVSLGIASAESPQTSLWDVMKRADERMYRYKTRNSSKVRERIVAAFLRKLEGMAPESLELFVNLCYSTGRRLNLPARQLANLELLARIHNIGQMSGPEDILEKKGPLTMQEWDVIRHHSEKGQRIALSLAPIAPLADLILKHHERWDGCGYPLGLKGGDTSPECRILAVVDAYCAMTFPRPYREMLLHEEALAELQRCAGTQFDPVVVEAFLEVAGEEVNMRS